MNEFKSKMESVMEQYQDGAITEREALARIVELASVAYMAAPKVEGIDS